MTTENSVESPKRGRGRPKKGEIVIKPIKKHDRPQITERNKVRYAKEAVKNAERIYKKFESPMPNPLNIEYKDLKKEAKEAWKYIYSQREMTERDMLLIKQRAIQTPDELLILYEAFLNYIRKCRFVDRQTITDPDTGEITESKLPYAPTQFSFASWLGVTVFSIQSVIQEFGGTKTEWYGKYSQMLSDILSEGSMLGAYRDVPTIFALKNKCDWADKREERTTSTVLNTFVAPNQALEALEALGYDRPKLIGGVTPLPKD